MATIIIPFAPIATQVFNFSAALTNSAGQVGQYTMTVTWNAFGQRYYLNCFDQQGVHQFTLPLLGSPDDYSISMSAGYFTTQVVFRTSTQNFEITDS